jgi:hypothetical protein
MGMDIRKLIQEALREVVTQDTIAFKNYLRMTDEEKGSDLAHTYSYMVEEFFDEEYDGDVPEEYVGMEPYEVVGEMEANNGQLFAQFCKWILNKFNMGGEGMEYDRPAWSTFDEGELMRNQWLVHFTSEENAHSIVRNGFTKGVDDISRLGWTTHLSDRAKQGGGYNFAYHWQDVKRYGSDGKYGDTAVIFMASGVRSHHYGDEEPQFIFYGNTAKHINLIYRNSETGNWEISSKTDRVLVSKEKVHEVVDWFVSFYDRFRNILN